jgi:hypothetical protein
MFATFSGLVCIGAGGTGLWYFLPKNGVVHPLTQKPFFDSMVAITIMSTIALGVALVVEALVG